MSLPPLVRAAREEDCALIFEMVRELADYERLTADVVGDADMLRDALFADTPRVFCDLAEGAGDHVVGFAMWFYTFSTFRGRHGVYVEDIFVRPKYRGHGFGRALLAHVARRCVAENCARLEWSVLDWNEPAIGFYRAQGAQMLDDWTMCRLSGESLWRVADKAR
ncbi:MAG: family N-acetyltransferase [Hyphomicrobiales bacterium]|nr:family N-acetyltransferase [Hyphomicrobiales bacterium]